MVLELISFVISIVSLAISLIVAFIEYRQYKESKPKIDIDLVSQSLLFRTRSKNEGDVLTRFDDGKMHKVPPEILTFDLSFSLINRGEKPIGVRGIYVAWVSPKFARTPEKFPLSYQLVENVSHIYGYDFNKNEEESHHKPFVLNGNEEKKINLKLEVSAYLSLCLEKNKKSYEEEFKKRYASLGGDTADKGLSKLPKIIILQIRIRDIRKKLMTHEVPFYLS